MKKKNRHRPSVVPSVTPPLEPVVPTVPVDAVQPAARRAKRKPREESSLFGQITGLVGSVKDQLLTLTRWPLRMVGVVVLTGEQLARLSPEQSGLFRQAGSYLHELRELAGLTRDELADALDIEDKGVLDALEQGTAALSFELILRLSSILARHDPLPFVIRMARTYDPEVWQFLHDWGVGRIPLQYERERTFVNILRARDEARQLSDEDFASLVDMTESAFSLGLDFMLRERGLLEEDEEPDDTADAG